MRFAYPLELPASGDAGFLEDPMHFPRLSFLTAALALLTATSVQATPIEVSFTGGQLSGMFATMSGQFIFDPAHALLVSDVVNAGVSEQAVYQTDAIGSSWAYSATNASSSLSFSGNPPTSPLTIIITNGMGISGPPDRIIIESPYLKLDLDDADGSNNSIDSVAIPTTTPNHFSDAHAHIFAATTPPVEIGTFFVTSLSIGPAGSPAAVDEPDSLLLLGVGLAGFAAVGLSRKKSGDAPSHATAITA